MEVFVYSTAPPKIYIPSGRLHITCARDLEQTLQIKQDDIQQQFH